MKKKAPIIKKFVNSLDHASLIGILILVGERVIGTNCLNADQKRHANIAFQTFIEILQDTTISAAEGFGKGLAEGSKK